MNRKRVLVTGAAGFVGAALTRRLLADGHTVHAVLRPATSRWRLADLARDLAYHEEDLRNEAALRALVARVRPELIYHLATHGAYSHQTDADRIIQSNILGTWNLLKALGSIEYELFVNTGSSSEYGFKDYAMRETDLLEPNSYYAAAKCAQTLLCQHVANAERRPITTFRLFSVYGPLEEPSRLIPTVVRNCLESRSLSLVEPDTSRDFVYIDDVVAAFLCTDQLARLSGEIINIGSAIQATIKQVVDLVLQHTGAQISCEWGQMPSRIWDAKTWVADITKSSRLLGWRPQTTLSDGLARTIAWTRAEHPHPPA